LLLCPPLTTTKFWSSFVQPFVAPPISISGPVPTIFSPTRFPPSPVRRSTYSPSLVHKRQLGFRRRSLAPPYCWAVDLKSGIPAPRHGSRCPRCRCRPQSPSQSSPAPLTSSADTGRHSTGRRQLLYRASPSPDPFMSSADADHKSTGRRRSQYLARPHPPLTTG
jgi:hypothetical protein